MGFNDFISILLGGAIGLVGMCLKEMYSDIRKIQSNINELAVKVAAEYVTKNELNRIYESLERIEDKLDKKLDKE